jgi:hypothetical protein
MSQVLAEAIEAYVMNCIGNIHTALLARIDSYDPVHLIATVKPLAKWVMEKDGKPVEMPQLIEVPVCFLKAGPFIIRPPYVPGDVVLVVFSEHALDKLMLVANPTDAGHNRKFALDDAIVIGGILTAGTVANAAGAKGRAPDEGPADNAALYIGNTKTNTRMLFRTNGDITIVLGAGNKLYLAKSGATHPVTFADVVKQIFDAHTHPGVATGPGSTGAPTQKMTGHDSDQVFTD